MFKKLKYKFLFSMMTFTTAVYSLSMSTKKDVAKQEYKIKFSEKTSKQKILLLTKKFDDNNIIYKLNWNKREFVTEFYNSEQKILLLKILNDAFSKKSNDTIPFRSTIDPTQPLPIDIDDDGWLKNIQGWMRKTLERKYKTNFESNGLTYHDRYSDIFNYWQGYNPETNIKIAVVEDDENKNDRDFNYYWADTRYSMFANNFIPATEIRNIGNGKYSNHSTMVTSIIAGKSGINPLLSVDVHSSFSFKNDLKNDIYLKYNVINMSWGYTSSFFNYSLETDSFLDNYIHNNPEKIFVISAGNNKPIPNDCDFYVDDDYIYDHFLKGYANSLNSIIVGSNDEHGNYSSFSTRIRSKNKYVNILANGENYNFYLDSAQVGRGTSFSAPFITGILGNSLRLYKHIYDKGYDSIIAKAALTAATKKLNNDAKVSYQNSLNEAGSGVFDYKKLKQAFNNIQYFDFNKLDKNILKNNEILIQKDVELDNNEMLNVATSSLYNPKNDYFPDFEIVLRKNNGNREVTVFQSISIKETTQFLRFVNNNKKSLFSIYLRVKNASSLKLNKIQTAVTWTKGL